MEFDNPKLPSVYLDVVVLSPVLFVPTDMQFREEDK
jgi:hypothetical protein